MCREPGGNLMRVYVAALIDKSLRSINAKLQKQLAAELRKRLKAPKSAVTAKELNTFIFLSGKKPFKGTTDANFINKIENEGVYKLFAKYCRSNKSKLQKQLRKQQELRETSKIVEEFIKEVDKDLAKMFEANLKKISEDLPVKYCEIQLQSYLAIWDFEEESEYRFTLSGFAHPAFTGSRSELQTKLARIVDKVAVLNFFKVFLKPTNKLLREMNETLEKLELGVRGKHYKTENRKLQEKLELFLRILSAKLSGLQDVDKTVSRIFGLFEDAKECLVKFHLKNESVDLNSEIVEMALEIECGKALLVEVRRKLQQCQSYVRDYLDENRNGVKIAESVEEFKLGLFPLAELSTELFVEAELLKMWSDFFGADLPYFSFNARLFDSAPLEIVEADGEPLISVQGLVKNYNLGRTTVYALRGVNVDIRKGEFVAIVGDSGAGKTTLLNCIAGLDTPDSGVVLFRGKDLHKMNDIAKSKVRLLEMGFIFQSYALLPHFTTLENVALPAVLAGSSKDLRERIERLLSGVGIDKQAKQYPAQLSGGQMQRVAIARALTNQPTVIFADEPTGDLDSVTGKQVMELLKKFHEETKTTIVIITHDKEIADYAKRQITLEDGIVQSSAEWEETFVPDVYKETARNLSKKCRS
jgi:putative ABC transport system ATP-binding protein